VAAPEEDSAKNVIDFLLMADRSFSKNEQLVFRQINWSLIMHGGGCQIPMTATTVPSPGKRAAATRHPLAAARFSTGESGGETGE
jgi:hypothetical protein